MISLCAVNFDGLFDVTNEKFPPPENLPHFPVAFNVFVQHIQLPWQHCLCVHRSQWLASLVFFNQLDLNSVIMGSNPQPGLNGPKLSSGYTLCYSKGLKP